MSKGDMILYRAGWINIWFAHQIFPISRFQGLGVDKTIWNLILITGLGLVFWSSFARHKARIWLLTPVSTYKIFGTLSGEGYYWCSITDTPESLQRTLKWQLFLFFVFIFALFYPRIGLNRAMKQRKPFSLVIAAVGVELFGFFAPPNLVLG